MQSSGRSMNRPSALIAGLLLATCVAQPTFASDKCTIMYRVSATFEVSDTDLGKGDTTVEDVKGSLVVEYPQDEEGRVTDGKGKILHYAMYESFRIDSMVTVTTTIHHFAPTCNGVDEPTWRLVSDEGFPSTCGYTGNKHSVATGTLRREDGTTLENTSRDGQKRVEDRDSECDQRQADAEDSCRLGRRVDRCRRQDESDQHRTRIAQEDLGWMEVVSEEAH